jgi:hypothetical protein
LQLRSGAMFCMATRAVARHPPHCAAAAAPAVSHCPHPATVVHPSGPFLIDDRACASWLHPGPRLLRSGCSYSDSCPSPSPPTCPLPYPLSWSCILPSAAYHLLRSECSCNSSCSPTSLTHMLITSQFHSPAAAACPCRPTPSPPWLQLCCQLPATLPANLSVALSTLAQLLPAFSRLSPSLHAAAALTARQPSQPPARCLIHSHFAASIQPQLPLTFSALHAAAVPAALYCPPHSPARYLIVHPVEAVSCPQLLSSSPLHIIRI